KSIAQGIKFIGRFGDKQRRLRQKCQLVSSTHLLTPVNLPDAGEVVLARPTCPYTQRISRDVSTDLRSEPRRGQPSSSPTETYLSSLSQVEGRKSVAQPLPDRRRWLSHRLEGPNSLRRLTP